MVCSVWSGLANRDWYLIQNLDSLDLLPTHFNRKQTVNIDLPSWTINLCCMTMWYIRTCTNWSSLYQLFLLFGLSVNGLICNLARSIFMFYSCNQGFVLKIVRWSIMVFLLQIVTWMESGLIGTHITSSYIYRSHFFHSSLCVWMEQFDICIFYTVYVCSCSFCLCTVGSQSHLHLIHKISNFVFIFICFLFKEI